jgi:hypothetical protein
VISWLTSGSGWGTREQAIPGEWAALVLIMVLGALLGLLVLWFTVLRHERTVRHRATRRPDGMVAFAVIGAAVDEKATPARMELEAADKADESDKADEDAQGAESVEDAEVDEASEAGDADKVEEVDAVNDVGKVDRADGVDGVDDEPSAGEVDEEAVAKTSEQPEQPSAAPQPARGASAKRKLTDEILSRVEGALAERGAPRWKELAELVDQEFGVSVHPSSIQKAVKRRRLAAARGETSQMARMMDRVGEMSAAAGGTGAAADETGGAGETGSAGRAGGTGAAAPLSDAAAPAPASASAPASAEARVEPEGDVRPNGGRRASAWSSPACPAADAG